jgi:hypothetical protein
MIVRISSVMACGQEKQSTKAIPFIHHNLLREQLLFLPKVQATFILSILLILSDWFSVFPFNRYTGWTKID